MKQLILTFTFLLVSLTAAADILGNKNEVAAEPLNENGEYERKVVVEVPGTTAQDLYLRALEILSDWKGSNGKSSSQIDVKDKETALVIYKGKCWIGFRKVAMIAGWDAFADFTLRIKCKDEKAQLTMSTSSMTFLYTMDNVIKHVPLNEIIPKYTHKTMGNYKKTAIEFAPQIPKNIEALIAAFAERMKQPTDDDF